MTITDTTFTDAWSAWRQSRVDATLGEYGAASLVATNWLADAPQPVEAAAGLWRAGDGRVVGTELADVPLGPLGGPLETRDEWVLAPGETITDGTKRLTAFSRGGTLALRVFDPASATRAKLSGIAAWDAYPAWVVGGPFRPAPAGDTDVVTTIDGVTGPLPLAGEIDLVLPGDSAVTLTVTRGPGGGLSAVFGDATNGVESYRFRFLPVGEPDGDGAVVVDFNRAFLPPCSFSDHFICPFPVAGNRWTVPVRAGERAVVLQDGRESVTGIH